MSSPRSSLGQELRALLRGALVVGALGYGATLSTLHVWTSQVTSIRDSLVTLPTFVVLYGGWCLACLLLAWLLIRLVSLVRSADAAHDRQVCRRHALSIGFFALQTAFWAPFFLYGLSYDEVPFGPPGRIGMVIYASLLLLVIVLSVGAVSAVLARFFVERSPRRARLATALVAAVFVIAHVALPLMASASRTRSRAAEPAQTTVRTVDTGVDLLIIGLDGADWRVLEPLIADGKLPTFAEIVARGASGPLATYRGPNSAVIWASLYSGKEPRQHTIGDFYSIRLAGMSGPGLYRVPRTFFRQFAGLLEGMGVAERRPVTRGSMRGVPIWEITDFVGLSTGVIDGYYYSFPAPVPQSDGSFFFAYGTNSFFRQLRKDPSLADTRDLFVQPPELFDRLDDDLHRRDFFWQSRTLMNVLADGELGQPRLLNLYAHQPDALQHNEWKWFEPGHYFGIDEQELDQRRNRIPNLHVEFDAFLQAVRAQVDPETVIAIVSDHGHSPTLLHAAHSFHRHGPPGVVILSGGPIRPGFAIDGAHVRDITPTLLHLLGLPVAEDMAGRVLAEALEPAFLQRFPVTTIPSYDFLDRGRSSTDSRSEELDRLELEKLKAMGYL